MLYVPTNIFGCHVYPNLPWIKKKHLSLIALAVLLHSWVNQPPARTHTQIDKHRHTHKPMIIATVCYESDLMRRCAKTSDPNQPMTSLGQRPHRLSDTDVFASSGPSSDLWDTEHTVVAWYTESQSVSRHLEWMSRPQRDREGETAPRGWERDGAWRERERERMGERKWDVKREREMREDERERERGGEGVSERKRDRESNRDRQ